MKKTIPKHRNGIIHEADFDSFEEFIDFTIDLAETRAFFDQIVKYQAHELRKILETVPNETLLRAVYCLGPTYTNKLEPAFTKTGFKRLKEDLSKMKEPTIQEYTLAFEAISRAIKINKMAQS